MPGFCTDGVPKQLFFRGGETGREAGLYRQIVSQPVVHWVCPQGSIDELWRRERLLWIQHFSGEGLFARLPRALVTECVRRSVRTSILDALG